MHSNQVHAATSYECMLLIVLHALGAMYILLGMHRLEALKLVYVLNWVHNLLLAGSHRKYIHASIIRLTYTDDNHMT